ncbi:MAG: hypothetical protein JWN70_6436 [Planctomycetaceae bacterium]|nr:hypothetical protein [Planctomycetaceae bacterium]
MGIELRSGDYHYPADYGKTGLSQPLEGVDPQISQMTQIRKEFGAIAGTATQPAYPQICSPSASSAKSVDKSSRSSLQKGNTKEGFEPRIIRMTRIWKTDCCPFACNFQDFDSCHLCDSWFTLSLSTSWMSCTRF